MIKKPKFGEPCNGCGICCKNEVCPIGKEGENNNIPPCKFLKFYRDKYRCRIVLTEKKYKLKPLIFD